MNIALVTASTTDGCAVYRSVGPFHHLPFAHTKYHGQGGYALWHAILQHPVLFIQRPWALSHMDMLHAAKALNRRIIIDWDDDLTNLPEWNPNALAYTQQYVKELAALADLVFVSTPHLRSTIPHHNIHVIPNALDPTFRNLPRFAKREPIVVWRGSKTHSKDLEAGKTRLTQLSRKYKVVFIGDKPSSFTIPNSEYIPHQDYAQYMVMLNYMRPAIFFASLADHPFNYSKSDVAAQEAYAVGARFYHNDTAAYKDLPPIAEPRYLDHPECNPTRERLIKELL